MARSTGNIEWWTPPWIIEGVRQVMGEIDLDPATSVAAQRLVQARLYYTAGDDGLSYRWFGRVFMNPPYARGLVDLFAAKFAEEWMQGHIREGCVLCNNATETAWFQTLAECATAMCALRGRVVFLGPSSQGNKGLQGQVLLYFGVRPWRFMQVWSQHGQVYLCTGRGLLKTLQQALADVRLTA